MVRRPRHRAASDDREILLVVNGRLWIEALLRAHASQSWVIGWLEEIRGVGMRPGVVAYEVEMLTSRRCDTERLLH